ncbi:undecaprenol kinase [Alteribacillus iranensis]|uniref:Undecaprenol kinase n=2 Tax=Alteribacillus iranensis TaxID=930128 RepID=A0A1I1ZAY2_9BACI|nr:undecaprenol kinase [Alteribacillus iranensis]
MRLHFLAALCTIGMGFIFGIPLVHWLVLILVIGGMLAFETINTAIERAIDYISEEYHPLAGLVKDIAAGAVFIFSITAFIIGVLIFYHPVSELFMK